MSHSYLTLGNEKRLEALLICLVCPGTNTTKGLVGRHRASDSTSELWSTLSNSWMHSCGVLSAFLQPKYLSVEKPVMKYMRETLELILCTHVLCI